MVQREGLLEIAGLTKTFGGLTALSDFNLSVKENEIVSIIGPNGAGKTTIFNLISSFYRPDQGEIFFLGNSIKNRSPHEICEIGITRTFQTTRLFKHLSVLENLKVGAHTRIGYLFWDELFRSRRLAEAEVEVEQQALKLLEEFDLLKIAGETAGNLPYGLQRLTEILRSLNTLPRLILLDEPAAGMNPQEAIHLMEVVERIKRKGVTVLLVEHNMDVVMEISDRIVVLNYGKKIAEGPSDEIQNNSDVIAAYLGDDIETHT